MTTADGHTFDAVWRGFHERLAAYVRRRVPSAHDADDVLQEIFLTVHTQAHRVRDADRFAGWLFRVAANAIADAYRRRPPAGDARAIGAEPSAPAPDYTEAASAELARCIEPFVDTLAEPYRSALRMTELEGRGQREAAERLGLSHSGMKSRVQRGREQLRARLERCCRIELDARKGVVGFERRDARCGCDEPDPA